MVDYWINIADIVDKETGKTYRQLNSEKTHNIPLGALVECVHDLEYPSTNDGLRLHVVYQGRDCDGTPLYWLGIAGKTYNQGAFIRGSFVGGCPKYSLQVIAPPTDEILEVIRKSEEDDD